jgi:glycerol-3-phosphate O-acyltransferase
MVPGDGTTRTVVLLAEARTPTERRLIADWARRHRAGAELLEVEPLRATRLPRRGLGGDLLLLLDPRRPNARLQSMIARHAPHRVLITAGEPGTARELRRRFLLQEETGTADGSGVFVARQAQLACDRAERQLVGDRYKVPRLVAEQIAASTRFRHQVRDVAEELGLSFEDALEEATPPLRELAAVQSPLAIDAFQASVRSMHAHAWTVRPDREAPAHAGAQPHPCGGLPPDAPVVRRPLTRPTSPATTSWAKATCRPADGPARLARGRDLHPARLRQRPALRARGQGLLAAIAFVCEAPAG